jgi:hypothetical protein
MGQIVQPGGELWKWIGRREAFGIVAGRCSAAEVETIPRIRDGNLYQELHPTWDEFCVKQLHVNRRKVDREITNLKRFGPAFFTLRQLTRVSVREYGLIADHISEDGVRVNGAVVPLLPEHSDALAGAVESLLARSEQKPDEKPAGFDAVVQKVRSAAKGIRSLEPHLDAGQAQALAGELAEILSAAASCGLVIGPR